MKGWLDETEEALGLNGKASTEDVLFAIELAAFIALAWFVLALLQ